MSARRLPGCRYMRISGALVVLALAASAVFLWDRYGASFPVPDGEPRNWAWEDWGASRGGTRYADIGQINPDNVSHLQVAWRYNTGELSRRSEKMLQNSSFYTTPIIAAGSLISCTPFGRLIALDPATGKERWVRQVALDQKFELPNQYVCRGVSQWRAKDHPEAMCGHRLFMTTVDLRMHAFDARTGEPCADFGTNGTVALPTSKGLAHRGEVKTASPPAIVGDVVVQGSLILDNVRAAAPRGIVNGYDVRSGALLWQFDPIPQDGGPTPNDWLKDSQKTTGAANMWSVMAVDSERDLVFLPTSSASPDYYGGLRPGDNRHANSVVALEGKTGRVVWAQQLVHHDIWDYDTPSQPTLIDIERDGRMIPALIQPTKQGFIFVFDRRDGKPLFPIKEVPVPQGAAPGEWLSPTQPMPTLPRPLFSTRLTPDDAFGLTPWERRACADLIRKYRFEGLFTPPSEQGTITYPAASGGANWGGGAIDPRRQLFFINSTRVASVITLIPRRKTAGSSVELSATADISPMAGTPYEVRREWLLSPRGAPCTPPPWGGLSAIDLRTGKTVWDVPLGTINNQLPVPIPFDLTYGTPNIGGPVTTKSGLLFIAATMDQYLRAFDMSNGKELWRAKLPGGSQTTPMTYMANGRQYVVVATGRHLWFGTPQSDEITAYALPMNRAKFTQSR